MFKKLVLIIPPSPWLISDTDLPFLGPLHISSYLKSNGYEVSVCDLSGLKEEDWRIPVGDIYGITGTTPHFLVMKRIAGILRERNSNCKIVAGGVHASVMPNQFLEETEVDIVVIGEGEKVMLEIMSGFHPYGIVYGERIENLNILPFPDRESLDFYRYIKPQTFKYLGEEKRETTLFFSRGCPFNCAFCCSPKLWDRKVTNFSVGRMVSEIKWLKYRYNIEVFNIVDDTFCLDKKRVLDFCSKVKDLNVNWHCMNRVDCCDDNMLSAMSDSGCMQVTFGFESGCNRILRRINKKTTVEEAYNAIKKVKKHRMRIRGQMIVGLPTEDHLSIKASEDFIRNAKEVDTFGIHVFQPFPGCDIWNNPKKYSYEIKNEDFDRFHTIGKPEEALTDDQQVWNWFKYLREVVGNRNIHNKGALDKLK